MTSRPRQPTLASPGAATLLGSSILARLPLAMFSIALLVHAQRLTGSFAIAGLVSGAYAIASAAAAPLLGGLVDRCGQTGVLLCGATATALVLLADGLLPPGAPPLALVVLGAATGFCSPPLAACVRTLLPAIVADSSRLPALFALESTVLELTFVAGPPLALGLGSFWSPGGALVVSGLVMLVGTFTFAAQPASRRWRPQRRTPGARGGSLRSPAIRTLVAILLGTGAAFGATEVGVTAAAHALGHGGVAGLLLGLWGMGSLLGGIAATRVGGGARSSRELVMLLAALALGHGALILTTGSLVAIGIVITLAGATIAPTVSSIYAMVDAAAPAGTETEAYSWLLTASLVGASLGSAAAGALAQSAGAAVSLLLVVVAGALAVLFATLRSPSLGNPLGEQSKPGSTVFVCHRPWVDRGVSVRRLGSRCAAILLLSLLAALSLLAGVASGKRGAAAAARQVFVKHPVAVGTGGAVASMDLDASKAGIQVLERGGNAVDAAVATASALGDTIPFVAGPGGGGFMVIYLAHTHQVVTIDGRETCPSACAATMFTNPQTGQPMDYDYESEQPLSTGVPGMVAAWAKAVGLYGRLNLSADLQPAIAVAEHGFRTNFDFQQLEQSGLDVLRAYPASRSLLLTKDGNPLPVGTLLRNPDLAKTYRLLARYGPSYLYDGPLGRAIVNSDDHPVLTPGNTLITQPGIMQLRDLRSYRARVQAPTRVTYRGLQIYGMPPPSSGGSTEGEILNILSGFKLSAEPRATALFHYLEASRLAYADRNASVGDPRFVKVPLTGLLSPAFAATRRCLIHDTALPSPQPAGDPYPPYSGCAGAPSTSARASQATAASAEDHHTNNIVAVDRWGDVVAYTNTINFFGGSGETVPGYGFLLNDEMTDFDFAPPAPGAYDPNLPAGGKIPRSSMGPIIAFRDGKPVFSIGAAGGSTIIETVVQTLINHVDFGMSLPAALAAPRVSQTNSKTSLAEPAFYNSPVRQQLQNEFGEQFTESTGPVLPLNYYPGDATALQILGHGRAEAIAEPVRLGGGSALVVHPSP